MRGDLARELGAFAVASTPDGVRTNTAYPSACSSAATCADTVGCVTPSSSAAFVCDPARNTVTNVRRWSRLGALTSSAYGACLADWAHVGTAPGESSRFEYE